MNPSELPPGVQRLRKAVIIMGYMLIIGTILLIVAAFFKFSHSSKPKTENAYALDAAPTEKCIFKPTANIEVQGNIINSTTNGNLLTIVTSKAASQQILIFDLCKGELVSRIIAS